MTARDMVEKLGIAPSSHPAWLSFVRQMANRQYGWDALNSAWVWFRNGWDDNKVGYRDPSCRKGHVPDCDCGKGPT